MLRQSGRPIDTNLGYVADGQESIGPLKNGAHRERIDLEWVRRLPMRGIRSLNGFCSGIVTEFRRRPCLCGSCPCCWAVGYQGWQVARFWRAPLPLRTPLAAPSPGPVAGVGRPPAGPSRL